MPHYNVLFLCTGNSAQLNHGLQRRQSPGGTVRPEAIRPIKKAGLNGLRARSKSWDEFSHSPHLSFVFTVCDDAANEVCPIWPGQPMTAHWGILDPAAIQGKPAEIEHAFSQAFQALDGESAFF